MLMGILLLGDIFYHEACQQVFVYMYHESNPKIYLDPKPYLNKT